MDNGRGCPWPDLPTPVHGPSILDLQTSSEVRKYNLNLFPISLFVCCLAEDLLRGVQVMYIWITTSNKQVFTLIIEPLFLGLGLKARGLHFSCNC